MNLEDKMTKPGRLTVLLVLLVAALSLACGASSLFTTPDLGFPTFAPTPADFGTPTGISSLSGDWSALTDFGKIAFTISPDGGTLVSLYVDMNNWTCGGVTLTTGILAYTDPPSSVDDGSFSMLVNLSSEAGRHYNEIDVSGRYDSAANQFTGEWVQDSISATCSGTWQTAPR
jgi:hypothetical protein